MEMKVRIQLSTFGKDYSVLVTSNGFQWTAVFSGNIGCCYRIAAAYSQCGYEVVAPEE